jgi:hypothetical protein
MVEQPTAHFLLVPNPICSLHWSLYQIPALLANCVLKKALNEYFTPSTKNQIWTFSPVWPSLNFGSAYLL